MSILRARQCARRLGILIRQSTLIAAALLLAGCYRYAEVSDVGSPGPDRTIGASTITTRDGAEFELQSATIGPDSVTGQLVDTRLAFPRSDVVRMRERKLSVPLTVVGSLAFAALVLPFVLAATVCGGDDRLC
jgi:hypothetical protein